MKKLILLLFIVFLACELFSGYWVDPMMVNPESPPTSRCSNPSMTWDSTGRVWVSWTYCHNGSYSTSIKASFYNGIDWSNPFYISRFLDDYRNVDNSMTTDEKGIAWIFWYYGDYPTKGNSYKNRQWDWGLEFSFFPNGSWTYPCLADTIFGAHIGDAITDSSGIIWIGWSTYIPYWMHEELYITKYDGIDWQTEFVGGGFGTWFSGLCFAPESTGVAALWAYVTYPWFKGHEYILIYKHNFGAGWAGYRTLYYDTTCASSSPTAAFDSSGRLWAIWQKHTQDNWCLCVRYRETGVWSNLKIIPSISSADIMAPCIKTDGYGKTWLAFESRLDWESNVYVSCLEDTTFTAFQKLSSQIGGSPELGKDIMGNIWAFWSDRYKIYASFYRRDTNPPRVTVIKPNGGEVYNYGETDTIKWSAEDEDTVVWVNIYFSSDGGNTYKLVSEFEKNDSNYEWTIPDVTSNNCLIEITAIDKGYNAISDESDSFFTVLGTGIYEEQEKLVKEENVKFQVFPNPFRDRVEIRLMMEDERWKMGDISLRIYNVTGCLVKEFSLPTTYSLLPTVISWDGRNNAGEKVTIGVYFLRFNAGDYKETRQLLLLR